MWGPAPASFLSHAHVPAGSPAWSRSTGSRAWPGMTSSTSSPPSSRTQCLPRMRVRSWGWEGDTPCNVSGVIIPKPGQVTLSLPSPPLPQATSGSLQALHLPTQLSVALPGLPWEGRGRYQPGQGRESVGRHCLGTGMGWQEATAELRGRVLTQRRCCPPRSAAAEPAAGPAEARRVPECPTGVRAGPRPPPPGLPAPLPRRGPAYVS